MMPWWVKLYLIAYWALLVFSLWDNVRDHKSRAYIVLDFLGDFTGIVLTLAYWVADVASSLGLFLPCILLYAFGWMIYSVPREIRKELPDAEFSKKENWAVGIVGAVMATVFVAPAYVWGVMVSWQQIK